jgi:hypothetical protein
MEINVQQNGIPEVKNMDLLVSRLEETLSSCNALADAFNKVSYSVVNALALARTLNQNTEK